MNLFNQEKLLTPQEVSDILGVTPATLAAWRCAKRYDLPYVKVGRLVRYRETDISNFIENRLVERSEDCWR